jgi:hypothetical protein
MKTRVFWAIMPRSSAQILRHFGRTYRFHLHGPRQLCVLPASGLAYTSTLKMKATFLRGVGGFLSKYTTFKQLSFR